MNRFYIYILAFLSFFTYSCNEKKYESNAILLKKAILSAKEKGEWEDAKSFAYKAREQDSTDANARVMFALALEQCDDLERAVEEIKVAVSLDPNNFMANYTKGRLLFKTEVFEDCPAPLESAKKIKPENLQVLLLLARSYAVLNINKKAINNYVALAKSKQYKDEPEIYNELGVLFFNKKDYKRSVRFLNMAFEKDNNSPSVCFNLGVFWDKYALLCEDNRVNASKAAKEAIKFYGLYVKLISVNPQSEPQQQKVLNRIEKLKKY